MHFNQHLHQVRKPGLLHFRPHLPPNLPLVLFRADCLTQLRSHLPLSNLHRLLASILHLMQLSMRDLHFGHNLSQLHLLHVSL